MNFKEVKKKDNLTVNRENAEHGDVFLPVNSYHCLIPFTYRELALHWHEEMEITFIQEGTSDYKVGKEEFKANAGDIILIPPYCTHSACEIPGKTMISDSMVFHLDYLGASNQDLSASKYLRPMAEGQLVMQEVIRESDDSHITSENRWHIKSALEFIANHYSEKISITQLAHLAGFSENYFMNLFRQYVGMSCVQYINHYRIQEAAHALEETTRSVSEIAMLNGFDNISYFNLQFKRSFGMTPREFRRNQLGL